MIVVNGYVTKSISPKKGKMHMNKGTTKLRNENETKRNTTKNEETKRNEVSQNETKYVKQSIKDPKTINEGVKIYHILSG